jgi:sugar (pentulose or hexulose) kinase
MEKYHIAVFDIGKTNKKLIIFDSDLNIRDIEKTSIEEYVVDEVKYDNLLKIEKWFIDQLNKKSSIYNIKIISISAHGATFTCIDEKGALTVPAISYTTDPGNRFHDEFFQEFGPKNELQKITGTPDFNLLLNIAKGIWFVKKRFHKEFDNTRHILNLPQYFCFKLTGKAVADNTYVGCHTYLWDFMKKDWSIVADKLGVRKLLPAKINNPWDVIGTITHETAERTGLDKNTLVTSGIHDSNASLLPHLITCQEDFVLNSTGTWCVIMHERENVQFKDDELGKVVFYNQSPFSNPVKTSIFMGGIEFEAYDEILLEIHGNNKLPDFDPELYEKISSEQNLFILPSVTPGTGQFPESKARIVENDKIYDFEDIRKQKDYPSFFRDKATSYAVLNLSLAIQTKISLDRSDMRNGMPLFTEGGFSRNKAYNVLLAAFYPESNIYLTSLNEATAYGAALIGKAALEKKHPSELSGFLSIEKKQVKKIQIRNLNNYLKTYLSLI